MHRRLLVAAPLVGVGLQFVQQEVYKLHVEVFTGVEQGCPLVFVLLLPVHCCVLEPRLVFQVQSVFLGCVDQLLLLYFQLHYLFTHIVQTYPYFHYFSFLFLYILVFFSLLVLPFVSELL